MPPRATYRLQFHKDFTFADAEPVVPYLAALGVSHVYASPILTARRGSAHGYDVVDPTRIDPELGGEPALRHFSHVLQQNGLGLVVDIVPNHMGVGGDENPWWLDVLRNGQGSAYASFFDIDWSPPEPELKDKLLAPFLGRSYGEALEAGEITLERDPKHGWIARYFHHVFPLRPEDATALDALGADAASGFDPANEEGRTALHELLERQHFRLAWWRTAGDAINWRRFFDVTELAALRAEEPEVFAQSHALVLKLYGEGIIDGLRVDHVDGLADPGTYCRELRAALTAREAERPEGRRERAWLVVEKIIARGETLDPSWETDGTTGYDFMNEVSLVQHDAAGVAALVEDWTERTGRPDFAQEEHAARAEILERAFSGHLDRAAAALAALAQLDPTHRDRPRAALRRAVALILTHFARYRSYAGGAGARSDGADMAALTDAITAARESLLPADRDHLDWIAEQLSPPLPEAPDFAARMLAINRFEQLSAPVAAKAVEDTAFYRYGPLLSRTDVGFDAGTGGSSIETWHADCAARLAATPDAMLATATHDHKRGEDVRARLAVLSERCDDWRARLDAWLPTLASWRETAGCAPLAPGDDIMLLQMIVGAWPIGNEPDLHGLRERLAGWQQKALREAKLRSSWDAPDADYEAAAGETLAAILEHAELADLRREIAGFVAGLMPAALVNTFVQTALKLCAPGIPDIYQGMEYLDLTLVDPDNRRPVDYPHRAQTLAQADASDPDCRKQRLIAQLLAVRRAHPDLFRRGSYEPLSPEGADSDHLIAFARRGGDQALVVAAPRLVAHLLKADGTYRETAFQGATLPLPAGYVWTHLQHGTPAGDDSAGLDVGAALQAYPLILLQGHRTA